MGASVSSQVVHASCIGIPGAAALIFGASGTGKSSLALQLISLGAELVADDRTHVTETNGVLEGSCPQNIAGLIEARGVGILELPYLASAIVTCAIDLDQAEPKRLPDLHERIILGVTLPCLWYVQGAHFPAAVLHYMRGAIPLPS